MPPGLAPTAGEDIPMPRGTMARWKAFAVSCNRRGGRAAAMLLALAVTGFPACGDDGGGPAAPTTPTPPVVQAPSDEDAARESVDAWMALLDAGNYSEAYEATGSFFKEEVTAEEFRSSMEERQTILGAVESRTLSSTQRLSTVPDAPPGDYFVFELDGVYELRPNARERVTAVSESGGWPVVGIYLIR